MSEHSMWQAKLAARIHDPAEKALVLLTDPAGHEGGTVRQLRQQLFDDAMWQSLLPIVKQADHWASAADRPQFPQDAHHRFAAWTQVSFAKKPELIHPLSGKKADLGDLKDVDFQQVKAVSKRHFEDLVQYSEDGTVDWQNTTLAFWRFGPELDAKGLKLLWQLLPADTRVPDHSIWSHLDLASAFAGAMAGDAKSTPSLLVMSFGPVQSFIAQARSTSDLWAGSHLLSTMVWQGLQALCERCGPDAVLFPQLRGIPQVDVWLHQKLGRELPESLKKGTDSNPLFSAALPNRFVAIVPADQAKIIAETVTQAVRDWVMAQGTASLQALCEKSDVADAAYAAEQVERQLQGFPEVYWMTVPWSLVTGNGTNLDCSALGDAVQGFYPEGDAASFIDSATWKLLSQEITVDGERFYHPNGGVLYPALFDVLERANAAAKSLRSFTQQHEEGYRCTLCGEREWLSPDKQALFATPKKRHAVLWKKLPASWSRKGKEHLCALCAMKRLWPSRFAQWVADETGKVLVNRFVVSTHTMALVGNLVTASNKALPETLNTLLKDSSLERVALPARLARNLKGDVDAIARLPDLLDRVRDDDSEDKRGVVESAINAWLGHKPEAYYAFILMDGDRMGAWLQGNEPFTQVAYRDCWHSQIRTKVDEKAQNNPNLKAYIESKRAVSPARHGAISAALNEFALHLTRYAVEEAHHGKLLYAGGDDVMAMIPVAELLDCMRLLRCLYSGHAPEDVVVPDEIKLGNGFVLYRERLLRVMGETATASAGAVVAHHTMPLQRVLKELRGAEHTAKEQGDRDAFSIRILKRSGGTVSTTAKWFKQQDNAVAHPVVLLQEMAKALGGAELSRRAAYHTQAWLRQLPSRAVMGDGAAFERMLIANLQRQFLQQFQSDKNRSKEENDARKADVCVLVKQMGQLASLLAEGHEPEWLENFLSVAEFLGRQGRIGGGEA